MFSVINVLTAEPLRNLNDEPVSLASKEEANKLVTMTYRHWRILRIPYVEGSLEIVNLNPN